MTRAEIVSGLANTAEHLDTSKKGAIALLIEAAALLASECEMDSQELSSRAISAHETMTAAKPTADLLNAASKLKH